MKIVLISNLYSPYKRGGAEVIAEQIVEGLKKSGHEVSVISSKPFQNFDSLKISKEEGIYRFYPLNLFYYLNDHKYSAPLRLIWHMLDVFNIHSFIQVNKILQIEKPDIVLTHNLKGLGYLTPLAIKKNKIKHIHTLHDVQLDIPSGLILWGDEKNKLHTFWGTRWYSKINQYLFNKIDYVTAPSQYLLDFYKKKGFFQECTQKVLRNPVSKPDQITKKQGKWSEMNYLYLGQIEKHKGIQFLIDTFFNYHASLQDFEKHMLHIVGDGSVLEKLKRQYSEFDFIKFHGRVSHSELPSLFETIDYTIFPSLCYENSPAVITESLSCGVPVICSDIGGAGELIQDGENGYKYEPGNTYQLLQILNQCKNNIMEINTLSDKAIDSVDKYTEMNYIEQLEQLF